MMAWWNRLSLQNKLQIPIQLVLLLVLMLAQVWVAGEFKQKLLEDAEQSAINSATQSFLALNAMMLNGNISQPEARRIYLRKMAGQSDVIDFHLARSRSLQEQYGVGLPEEQARDKMDHQALASNQIQIEHIPRTAASAPMLRVVVPFPAQRDFHGTNCLQCHQVREGEVNGAISLTVSLGRGYAELANIHTLLSFGQALLQVTLFFLIRFFIRKTIRTVVRLEKTMLTIESDGDLSQRAMIEGNDEVGHIAKVFNGFLQYIEELKRQLADKVAVLEQYHDRNEQEQKIAAGYMNKLIAADKLRDPAVRFHLKPAANFSGDLIAISRTPDERLHLLLADSTGHGLSAALAAMPIIHPFYSMTSKGFSIAAIAREINSKICRSLPVSHFVAAILVSVDSKGQTIEVWSGGCPPPLLLNDAGACVHQFKPRHLAMGILPPEDFDAAVEFFSYEEACSLVMFSDGVIELNDRNGQAFGLQRLLAAANIAAPLRWQNIVDAIQAYCDGPPAERDDIALLMAECKLRGSAHANQITSRTAHSHQGSGMVIWQLALSLSMPQIKKMDVVPFLLDVVQQIERDEQRGGEIFMILSELFNNALDHGLLKLDSTLKHHEEGMERYYEERADRLAKTETGLIQLRLEKVLNEDASATLRVHVNDSGDGFDHHHVITHMATGEQRHGRGIPLLYRLCSSVTFLNNGAEAVVEFEL